MVPQLQLSIVDSLFSSNLEFAPSIYIMVCKFCNFWFNELNIRTPDMPGRRHHVEVSTYRSRNTTPLPSPPPPAPPITSWWIRPPDIPGRRNPVEDLLYCSIGSGHKGCQWFPWFKFTQRCQRGGIMWSRRWLVPPPEADVMGLTGLLVKNWKLQ